MYDAGYLNVLFVRPPHDSSEWTIIAPACMLHVLSLLWDLVLCNRLGDGRAEIVKALVYLKKTNKEER